MHLRDELLPDPGGISVGSVVDHLPFLDVRDMCDESGYELQHAEFDRGIFLPGQGADGDRHRFRDIRGSGVSMSARM